MRKEKDTTAARDTEKQRDAAEFHTNCFEWRKQEKRAREVEKQRLRSQIRTPRALRSQRSAAKALRSQISDATALRSQISDLRSQLSQLSDLRSQKARDLRKPFPKSVTPLISFVKRGKAKIGLKEANFGLICSHNHKI